jgi:hypothetical protein
MGSGAEDWETDPTTKIMNITRIIPRIINRIGDKDPSGPLAEPNIYVSPKRVITVVAAIITISLQI